MITTPFTLERATERDVIGAAATVALGIALGFWSSWWAVPIIVLGLVWWFCTRIRSIDVERDGLRIRRLFRSQFVPFAGLGRFTAIYQSVARGPGQLSARARLTSRGSYRSYGIFPSRTLSIDPRYRIGSEGAVLSVEELVDLLERCREQSAVPA